MITEEEFHDRLVTIAPPAEASKSCAPIGCQPVEDLTLTHQPWLPTLAELRQAGAAIMQPDGSYYIEQDGQVVHVPPAEQRP